MSEPNLLGDILLVEDNPGDIRLTKEMFKDTGLNPTFHVVFDGNEALDFLSKRDKFADAPTPDIVLLDWHLPQMDGDEVLTEVNGDTGIKNIPVVVQSGSGVEVDVIRKEGPEADAYVQKPLQPDEFVEVIDDL